MSKNVMSNQKFGLMSTKNEITYLCVSNGKHINGNFDFRCILGIRHYFPRPKIVSTLTFSALTFSTYINNSLGTSNVEGHKAVFLYHCLNVLYVPCSTSRCQFHQHFMSSFFSLLPKYRIHLLYVLKGCA
jgi:hypothetical protein